MSPVTGTVIAPADNNSGTNTFVEKTGLALTPGRQLLFIVYTASATTTITSIVDQAGLVLTPAPTLVRENPTSATHLWVYRWPVPAVPPTTIRVNFSSGRRSTMHLVSLLDFDPAAPIDTACFAVRETPNSVITETIGPTAVAVAEDGSLAIAVAGPHNNATFGAWGGSFTKAGADTARTSMATRAVNAGQVLSAIANWTPTLFAGGVLVVVRGTVPNAPPTVGGGGSFIGAIGVPSVFAATVSDPDDSSFAYAWTLQAKPAASARVTADIVNRTTSNATFTPDVEAGGAEPFVLRCTVSDGTDTGFADFTLSVPNPGDSIPFFYVFGGDLYPLVLTHISGGIPITAILTESSGSALQAEDGTVLLEEITTLVFILTEAMTTLTGEDGNEIEEE